MVKIWVHKYSVLVVLMMALLTGTPESLAQEKPGPRIAPLPPTIPQSFTLEDVLSDEVVTLSDFRDLKVVLIVFVDLLNEISKREVPSYKHFYEKYSQQGFEVLLIQRDRTLEEIKPSVENLAVSFPVLLDHENLVHSLYNVVVHPTEIIIPKDGRTIAYHHRGSRPCEDERPFIIEHLLKKPAPD